MSKFFETHDELMDYAIWFSKDKGFSSTVRFEDGWVKSEINDSCHCHSNYVWEEVGTYESFEEWLEKNYPDSYKRLLDNDED